jgi:hypothetical protein
MRQRKQRKEYERLQIEIAKREKDLKEAQERGAIFKIIAHIVLKLNDAKQKLLDLNY